MGLTLTQTVHNTINNTLKNNQQSPNANYVFYPLHSLLTKNLYSQNVVKTQTYLSSQLNLHVDCLFASLTIQKLVPRQLPKNSKTLLTIIPTLDIINSSKNYEFTK
eukprot:TRINITY_DN59195_c0_g1_i1.p3 TRINITY_DN59195_c0_g1~~TRINITY_DN59195_c0_g1_i1.p3  ORF type:complete len:106 (-),score=2.03 TRINITY_DN59195_c0_g1_i1:389-706(-)